MEPVLGDKENGSQYDEDQPVYIRNDNGYTYGSVQMDSVAEGEEDEDE